MRFLVDECTGPVVANWLRDQLHEVFSVYDEARGMHDDDIITKAVLLRLANERASNKIAVLKRLLESHADRLHDQFVVVTETRVRFGP